MLIQALHIAAGLFGAAICFAVLAISTRSRRRWPR